MSNNNTPAFPSHGSMGEVAHEGMNLRDYFAAQAMPTIISLTQHHDGSWDMDTVAIGAYQIADAMLAEREKEVGHV